MNMDSIIVISTIFVQNFHRLKIFSYAVDVVLQIHLMQNIAGIVEKIFHLKQEI